MLKRLGQAENGLNDNEKSIIFKTKLVVEKEINKQNKGYKITGETWSKEIEKEAYRFVFKKKEGEHKSNDNIIGSNIRRIHLEKSIGQTELVKQLQLMDVDITRETLVKIESGKQHIKLEQLKGIKKFFDATFIDLLEKKNK